MSITSRALGVVAVAATITLLGGTAALAEANGFKVGQRHVLRMADYDGTTQDPSPDSGIRWRYVADSPIDTNARALVAHIAPGDFAEVYTNASLEVDTPVGEVKNLSYDERTDTTGAGAPRISVIFTNGDVAYLASSTCSNPIAVSASWNRADFTGEKRAGLCSFNVTGTTGGLYTSDGTSSAWGAYAAEHPDQEVSYTFMVFDEPGDYTVDRVSLGTDRLYNYGPWRAKNCLQRESRC